MELQPTLLLLFLSDSSRTPVRQGILWRARGSGQAQIKPAKNTGGKLMLAVYWTLSCMIKSMIIIIVAVVISVHIIINSTIAKKREVQRLLQT